MHNRHLARLFSILIFVFLASGAYLLLPDQPKRVATQTTPQNIVWSDVATNTVVSENKPTAISTTATIKLVDKKNINTAVAKINPITTTTTTEVIKKTEIKNEEIKNPINATIEITDKKYLLQLPDKATAYDAMQKLVIDKKISVTMKEFSGMGEFLEEIDGLKNNNQTGEYWIYYINGQSAKMGISTYVLKNNDLITWKYEHAKF